MRRLTPSLAGGYAYSAGESEYPELWQELRAFWAPAMGCTGLQLFDFGPLKMNHASLTAAAAQITWGPSPVVHNVPRPYGESGYAVLFGGGAASRGIVSNHASLSITGALTIAARIYLVATANFGSIIDRLDQSNLNNGYLLGTVGTGLAFTANAASNAVTVTSALSAGTWYTVGGTFNPATGGGIRVYRDGEDIGGNTTLTAPGANTDSLGVCGSTEFDNSDVRVNAYFAWGGVWGRPLTPDEILLIHRVPLAPLIVRKRITAKTAGGTTFNKSYSESQGHSDAFTRTSTASRVYSDNKGHTDLFVRRSDASRVHTDNKGYSDAFARISDALRANSDNQGHADAYSRVGTGNRVYTESQGHNDVFSRVSSALRVYADNQGHADAYTRVSDALRALSDTLGITDAATLVLVTTGAFSIAVVEALGHSDAYQRVSNALRALADVTGLADAYARLSNALRSFNDNQGHADAFARTSTANRTYSETTQLSDAPVRQVDYLRAVNDLVGKADASARTTTALRSLADNLAGADAYARMTTVLRALSEQTGTSDEYRRIASTLRALSDMVALIDDPNVVLNPFVTVLSAIFLIGLAQRNVVMQADAQRNVELTGDARVGS